MRISYRKGGTDMASYLIYGINTADRKVDRGIAEKYLKEMDAFDEYMQDNGIGNPTDADVLALLQDYETQEVFPNGNGPAALLADIIHRHTGIEFSLDTGTGKDVIGIEPRLPWDLPRKMECLTEKQFHDIIHAYANPLFIVPPAIQYWNIETD